MRKPVPGKWLVLTVPIWSPLWERAFAQAPRSDPLALCNDGPAKRAILDLARATGIVLSVKNDWKRVFAFDEKP